VGLLNPRAFFLVVTLFWFNLSLTLGDAVVDPKEIPLEYQVKSAFVFNFARFVSWPDGTFPTVDSPIIIGVLGRGEFLDALRHTIAGKTVEGRPLEVKKVESVETLAHVLVLSKSEAQAFPSLLKALRGKPVLTISEAASFLKHGGMVQLSVDDDQVRFTINREPIQKAGLSASSQMLQYAKKVR
jgi:hypothetical protein